MTFLDRIILLVTGLAALYPSGDRLYQHYRARSEEVRRTHIPRRCRLDHLLGTLHAGR
jgi:hypothetical protein